MSEEEKKPDVDAEPKKENPYKYYRDTKTELAKAKNNYRELHKDNKAFFKENLQHKMDKMEGNKLAMALKLKDLLEKTEHLCNQDQEAIKSDSASIASSSTLNVLAEEFKPQTKLEVVDSDPELESVTKLIAKPGGFNISLSQCASSYSNPGEINHPSISSIALNYTEPEIDEESDDPIVTIYKATKILLDGIDEIEGIPNVSEEDDAKVNVVKSVKCTTEGSSKTVGDAPEPEPQDTNSEGNTASSSSELQDNAESKASATADGQADSAAKKH